MALSDNEILDRLKEGSIEITPFERKSLNPAGYDLHSALEVTIEPTKHALIACIENIRIGLDIAGTIHLRTSFAREGIIGSFGLVDPGWEGQLTLMVVNASDRPIKIRKGEPLAQLVFHKLGRAATKKYSGNYLKSVGPVESKRWIEESE